MEKKRKITQYRERLDKTLSSPELRNEENLKVLVKKQLLHTTQDEIGGFSDKLVEKRTAEVSNFLDMLRSVSMTDTEASHGGWKLKQNTEEFRVMYHEGPQGTPFHSLLVEGYVDASVDVCLCVSWESTLYRKWWPHYTFPPFKIMASECLQKVRIGEQISLVRVKVTWPLSAREALIHYFLFEYFQDDLIVVLVNTISDLKSIDKSTHGFTKDGIPEAKDVVRIDMVGGFALQKVTQNRSYFRTIANMDMKLDFAPPSLINFISRQLIGSGFKLYQKTVVSVSNCDEDYSEALQDPLYSRLREALYSTTKSNEALGTEELKNDACIHPKHTMEDGSNDMMQKTPKSPCENGSSPYKAQNLEIKVASEIEESTPAKEDGGEGISSSLTVETPLKRYVYGRTDVVISPRVQQALQTLEKAILMVREYGYSGRNLSSSVGLLNQEPSNIENGAAVRDSTSKEEKVDSDSEVSVVKVSETGTTEKTVHQESKNSTGIHDVRSIHSNSYSREMNHNRIAPASPEQDLQNSVPARQVIALTSSQNGNSDTLILDKSVTMHDNNKQTSAEASSVQENTIYGRKKSSKNKRHRFWCFSGNTM